MVIVDRSPTQAERDTMYARGRWRIGLDADGDTDTPRLILENAWNLYGVEYAQRVERRTFSLPIYWDILFQDVSIRRRMDGKLFYRVRGRTSVPQ